MASSKKAKKRPLISKLARSRRHKADTPFEPKASYGRYAATDWIRVSKAGFPNPKTRKGSTSWHIYGALLSVAMPAGGICTVGQFAQAVHMQNVGHVGKAGDEVKYCLKWPADSPAITVHKRRPKPLHRPQLVEVDQGGMEVSAIASIVPEAVEPLISLPVVVDTTE
jgi:hypothetical protein